MDPTPGRWGPFWTPITPEAGSLFHADQQVLALERLALMVMRTRTGQSRRDVLDYAIRTIDLIVQVGRRGGRRGVLEVYLPALEQAEQIR